MRKYIIFSQESSKNIQEFYIKEILTMSVAKLVEVSVNMGFFEFLDTARYLSRYNLDVPTHSACGDGIFQVGRSMPLFLGGIYTAREYAFIDTLNIRNCGKKVDKG